MNRSRVEQILNQFSGKTILILGDVMLDEFIWGKVRRISPEAPVPVVLVVNETYCLGGSANVAANVQALDGRAIPVGVIGSDSAGDRIVQLMKSSGIETSALVRTDRPTTLKSRIIAHSQQVVRTDRESREPITAELSRKLADAFLKHLPRAEAVIVSDYDKGVVNRELLSAVLPEAKRTGVPIFLDPKVHHADYYQPITGITPNQHEAELLTGMAIHDEHSLEAAGRMLLQKFECEYALITRGEEGMSLFNGTGSHHLKASAREVFDVTGAGDTVIATLAGARSGGATMEEAAEIANLAAGIVVGKLGTATVRREELLSHFETRDAHSAG